MRIFQELDNFLELFLRFIRTGDVLEGGLFLLSGKKTGAGFAEAECLIAASLHLTHEEEAEADEQKEWGGVQENQNPISAAYFLHLDLETFLSRSCLAMS